MPVNDFKPFAVGGGASVVSQAAYAAAAALLANGYQVGVADPNYLNKTWRQSSLMAAVIGALINAQTGSDAIDDGTTATLLTNLTLAIQAVARAGDTVATTGGSHTLSAAEYGPSFITVTGVLVSNATLVFPTATGRWTVVNNTTGAYTLTCKTAAGAGVTVTQGKTDTVVGDGVNVAYAGADTVTAAFGDSSLAQASTAFVQAAISAIGGYYVDSGAVANAYIIAPIPALSGAYVTGMTFRIRTTRTGTGASTLDAGLGAKPLILESGNPTASGDVHGLFNVVYDATVGGGSWIMAGEAVSELGALAKENFGQGLEDDGAGNARVKIPDSSIRRSATGVQTASPIASVSAPVSLALTDNNKLFVATSAVTFTAPVTTSLWNGFKITIYANSGASTFQPNAADQVNGGAAGVSFGVVAGQSVEFGTDGAGKWWATGRSSPPGIYYPAYESTGFTVSAGTYATDTTGGAFTLTLPASPAVGDSCTFIDDFGTWSTNNLVIGRNGNTIMGSAANFNCDRSGYTITFMWNGTDWRIR